MCPRAYHIPSSQIGEETIPSEWISLYIEREKHNFNNMNIFCPMHALCNVNDTFVHHATGHLPAPASWAVRVVSCESCGLGISPALAVGRPHHQSMFSVNCPPLIHYKSGAVHVIYSGQAPFLYIFHSVLHIIVLRRLSRTHSL